MKNSSQRKTVRNIHWNAITLNQLQMFEAAARHGNITRAAEELSVTQPTVSIQLKHLANVVGMPLFEQVRKRLYLTEAGEEVLRTCQQIFAQLEHLESTISDFRGIKQGRLRLATTSTANYFISKLLTPFCQRYPDVSISLEVKHYDDLLSRLNENQDDFYILSRLPKRDDIEIKPFLCNPLVAIAPANHPLVGKCRIPLTTLTNESFIMREQGSGTREATEEFFQSQNLSISTRIELGSNEAVKQAVMEGLGISILSLHSLTFAESSSQLSILDVEGLPIQRQWYAVFPKRKSLSVTASTFMNYLLQEGARYCQTKFDFANQSLAS